MGGKDRRKKKGKEEVARQHGGVILNYLDARCATIKSEVCVHNVQEYPGYQTEQVHTRTWVGACAHARFHLRVYV